MTRRPISRHAVPPSSPGERSPFTTASRRRLMAAIRHGDVATVLRMCREQAPLPFTLPGTMVEACAWPDDRALPMVDALLNAGVNPNTPSPQGPSLALSVAVRERLWGTASRLLDAGAIVAGPAVGQLPPTVAALVDVALHGPMPLLRAWLAQASCGGRGIVQAGMRVCDSWSTTGLVIPSPPAERARRRAVLDAFLDAFLDAGMPIDSTHNEGLHQRSALQVAVVMRDAEMVGHLLERGASTEGSSFEPMPTPPGSVTPMATHAWLSLAHLAVRFDDRAVVERLLAHGVSFHAPATTMGTPLAMAARYHAQGTLVAVEQRALRGALDTVGSPARPRSRL